MCGKSLHTLYPVAQKMAQKYTLSHKNFAKIHCFKRTLKGILPHDTLSHNFPFNCNTLSHDFYQKRIPCRLTFTVKGHPVERHIPSSQVWEYPPPRLCLEYLNIMNCCLSILKQLLDLEIGKVEGIETLISKKITTVCSSRKHNLHIL